MRLIRHYASNRVGVARLSMGWRGLNEFQCTRNQILRGLFRRKGIQQLQYFLNLGDSFTHGFVGGGKERAGCRGGVAAIQNEVSCSPILFSQLRFHNNPGTK